MTDPLRYAVDVKLCLNEREFDAGVMCLKFLVS